MGVSEQVRQIARNLLKRHGKLLEVRCLSDPPNCRIELVFADGHEIIVTKHTGNIDITMLKFGYAGNGPQCFHSFLNEAGFDISYQEIILIKAPHILRHGEPFDFSEGYVAREDLLTKGFIACELAQYAKARALYAKAGELYPGDSVAWFNLGVVEYRAGNFDTAADAFKRVSLLKEHLVDGAYGRALCLQKLGSPLEWPSEYAEKPGIIGVEGPIRNLARELQNRGYVIALKLQGENCALETMVGQVKYTVTLYDMFGQLLGNTFREEGGKSVSILDRSAYPNPTDTDKEFISLGNPNSRRLAQMSVGPAVMSGERYTELSKAADLQAITQEHGPHRWTRRGQTYEEKDAEYVAKLPPNMKFTRVFSFADLIAENEPGTFTVCAFEGKPHLVAELVADPSTLQLLRDSIEAGRILLRTSCYNYPTYPIIYNRIFVVFGSGPQPGSLKGVLVESATDFTEANFQEWAITLKRTQCLELHVYNDKREHLASGEVQVDPEVIRMITEAIDTANEMLKAIPAEKQSFSVATKAFFRDHPEPFLFEKDATNDM